MSIRWVSGRCVVVGMVKAWSRVRTGRTSGGGGLGTGRLGGWEAGVQRVAAFGCGCRRERRRAWLGLTLRLGRKGGAK
jgi:hypothetical protein